MEQKQDFYKDNATCKMNDRYKNTVIFLLVNWIISGTLIYFSNAFTPTIENGVLVIYLKIAFPLITLYNLITLVINSAFAYSRTSIFIDITDDKEFTLIDKFKLGFIDNIVRSVILVFVRNLLIFLWTILLIIPGIIKAYSYSMALYLIRRKHSMGGIEAINKSKELTKGHKKNLFLLDLSYLGWYLLGILTLGVLWLWIVPKHLTARTLIFNEIFNSSGLNIV